MAINVISSLVKTLKGSIDTDQQAFVVEVAGDPDGGAPGTLVRCDFQVMLKAIVDRLAQLTANQMIRNLAPVVGRDHVDADRLSVRKELMKSNFLRLVEDDGRGLRGDFF